MSLRKYVTDRERGDHARLHSEEFLNIREDNVFLNVLRTALDYEFEGEVETRRSYGCVMVKARGIPSANMTWRLFNFSSVRGSYLHQGSLSCRSISIYQKDKVYKTGHPGTSGLQLA